MIIEFIFAAVLFLLFAVLCGRGYIHMLQQNSYKSKRYLSWLSANRNRLFEYRAVLPVSALFFGFINTYAVLPASAVLFALILPIKTKKAKKPLVYTARVKRLFAAYSVILLAVIFAALPFLQKPFIPVLIFAAAGLLTPYIVLASLFITAPIEKAIAHWYYNDAKKRLDSMKELVVIGVTGSYGKTSTKYIVTRLLSEKYDVLMTPGSYNTTMGVVRTIREQLKPTHKIFVVEMGAKNKGDIAEICRLVKPKYGIISSIGPQHLESFKTIENIVSAKFELAEAVMANGGTMFLNYDNEYIRKKNFDGAKVTYGKEECDVKVRGISYGPSGTDFEINGSVMHTKLLGSFNALNIAGAYAVASTLGVPDEDISVAVRRLVATPHRLELLHNPRYTIIDDAYNSNPSGAAAALDTLKVFSERKILVTPGMVELGARQEELNREFGAHAARVADYIVLVGAKQAGPIKQGVLESGFDGKRLYVASDINDALKYVYEITDVPSVVLLENDLPDNFL